MANNNKGNDKRREALRKIREATKNLKRQDVDRFVMLAALALWKADGTQTAFARKYKIKNPEDLYKFFKDVKNDLRNDRESKAFDKLTDMSKSVFGRALNYFRNQMIKRGVSQSEANDRAPFAAHQFVMRTTGYALDNLKKLQGAFKHFTKELATAFTSK